MLKPEINPYQPPTTNLEPTPAVLPGIWRNKEGNRLFVEHGAIFPDFCIKCNRPANGYRVKQVFSWWKGLPYLFFLYLFILLYTVLFYCLDIENCPNFLKLFLSLLLILAFFTLKVLNNKISCEVGMCKKHYIIEKIGGQLMGIFSLIIPVWLLFVTGFTLIWLMLTTLFFFGTLIIFGMDDLKSVVKETRKFVILKNLGPAFMHRFPIKEEDV